MTHETNTPDPAEALADLRRVIDPHLDQLDEHLVAITDNASPASDLGWWSRVVRRNIRHLLEDLDVVAEALVADSERGAA